MTRKRNRLLLGLGVLVVAVIAYERSVVRRNLIVRAETQLAAEGAQLRGRIEAGAFRNSFELNAALERVRRESTLEIVSIQMRGPDGAVFARAGSLLEPAFPAESIQSRSQGGLPLFKVRERGAGTVVVEAFAIQLPAATSRTPNTWLREVAQESQSRAGVVEIAARLRPNHIFPTSRSRRLLVFGFSRLS